MGKGRLARPSQLEYDSGASLIRSSADETSATNSSPKSSWRSSYQSVALRSSVRASACSSTRTPLVEFLQNLGSRCVPIDRLNTPFGDIARTALQLAGPG